MQNKKGKFVAPSLQTANDALSGLMYPENFVALAEDSGQGYPIVGLSWTMINRQYSVPDKANAIKRIVRWALTDGQGFNNDLGYTRIPSDVTSRVLQVVENTIK